MTTPPPRSVTVLVDANLMMALQLQKLLQSLDVIDDPADVAGAQIAVLSTTVARSLLPAVPPTMNVIVIARHHERESALDLYRAGAAMVIVEPPVEEISARVRAIARHLDQLAAHAVPHPSE